MGHHSIDLIYDVIFFASLFTLIINFIILLYWLIYYLRNVIQNWRAYKYIRDNEDNVLLRERLLYNYSTTVIKDSFITGLHALWISTMICAVFLALTVSKLHKDYTKNQNESFTEDCREVVISYRILYYEPVVIVLIILTAILFFIFAPIVMCMLVSYLEKRYLVHPWRRSLYAYLKLALIETLSLLVCSTKYTLVFGLYIILPTIMLLNYILQVKSCRKLAQALKIKMREIEMYEWDEVRYNSHKQATKVYTRLITLYHITVFFENLIFLLFMDIYTPLTNIKDIYCLLEKIYPVLPRIGNSSIINQIGHFHSFANELVGLVILVFYSLPLCLYTVSILVVKCIKRRRSKVFKIYNLDALQPLLKTETIQTQNKT